MPFVRVVTWRIFGGSNGMIATNRQLMWHGMFLFVLGLITGLAEQRFTNVRMGLAAHLEGVMNGTFLIALGAIWNEVRLPRPGKLTAYWTALYGTYANWLTTTFAAIFGTAARSPITSAGHSGQPWQEALVSAGFLSVSISIVGSGVLLVWGLRASASMSQERRGCEPMQPNISVPEINDNERTQ
jgi:(hydroxyamino)benzene mutase